MTTASFLEDYGDHGQIEFGGDEYADLYVGFRISSGTVRYWLMDEGEGDSARRGPAGWRTDVEEMLADRGEHFEEAR